MRMTTAAMQDRTFRWSWYRREKKLGMVMAPTLAVYRRRRLATMSQLR